MEGVLYLPSKESAPGVLVTARANYLPSPRDPIVPRDLVTREGLEAGALVTGFAADGGRPVLRRVVTIEGLEPSAFRQRPSFNELVSIDPHDHLKLETEPDEMCGRVVDLLAPIGRGQRCLIVAPPKAGKTTLLKRMAHAVSTNDPDVYVIVLLVDERPEEVTDFRRSVERGRSSPPPRTSRRRTTSRSPRSWPSAPAGWSSAASTRSSSSTRSPECPAPTTRCRRGAARSSRAASMRAPWRSLAGSSARRATSRAGGSLTIIATALVDTGSRMDEIIFQEFKGTGNTEILLDRDLFNRRIFPCINIPQSGTRKEEKIYGPEELPKIVKLRRALAAVDKIQAMELVLGRLSKFRTNRDFLNSF